MARRRINSLQIPDGFRRFGVMIGEETAPVIAIKDTRETPFVALQGTNIQEINDQDVARLSAIDMDRATEDVNNLKIDITNIARVVIIFNLTVCPVFTLNPSSAAASFLNQQWGRNGRDKRLYISDT